MEALSILLVDDEELVLHALERTLTRRGAIVTAVSNPMAALELVPEGTFDAVVSDLGMPDLPGLDLLARCRAMRPDIYRVALTGAATLDAALRALNERVTDKFFLKPWSGEDIDGLVSELRTRRQRRRPYTPDPAWVARVPDAWRQALGLLGTRIDETA